MTGQLGLQERYAPHNACFGCGPANPKGLRIRSLETSDDPTGEVICTFRPETHHEAFEGILNGGIIGTLLDCHSNWTASWHLMVLRGLDRPPCTVTADFHVRMKRPTPSGGPVMIRAHVTQSEDHWVTVEAEIEAEGRITATCTGRFVAVGPDHPAAKRW